MKYESSLFHHRIEKLCTAINSSTKIFSGSKLQTAAPLCRFSIYFIGPKKPYCSGLEKSKLQSHLQAFPFFTVGPLCKLSILFCRTKRVQYCRGLKSPSRWAICRPLILFSRAERIPTADSLCKFSILLHRTEKIQTAGDWKVQVFYSLV